MATMKLRIDTNMLSAARAFDSWKPILEKHLQLAMKYSMAGLQSDARAYVPYLTGALSDSIDQFSPSPYIGFVFTDSPYGWIQEEGFSGMTNSRGAYYPNYPGHHYMQKALSRSKTAIREAFEAEVDAALGEVTGMIKTGGIQSIITGY